MTPISQSSQSFTMNVYAWLIDLIHRRKKLPHGDNFRMGPKSDRTPRDKTVFAQIHRTSPIRTIGQFSSPQHLHVIRQWFCTGSIVTRIPPTPGQSDEAAQFAGTEDPWKWSPKCRSCPNRREPQYFRPGEETWGTNRKCGTFHTRLASSSPATGWKCRRLLEDPPRTCGFPQISYRNIYIKLRQKNVSIIFLRRRLCTT